MDFVLRMYEVFKRNKRALAGFIILFAFLIMALVGPFFVKLDMTARFDQRFQWPSAKHILGTDYVGRDVFAQIVHGSRDVLIIAFLAALFTTFLALLIGMISGFAGGKVDIVLMLITNIMLTIPSFPVMMILSALIRIQDPVTFAIVLSIWSWGGLARAVRSQVMSLKQRDFIEAAKLMDLPVFHIVFNELLPNMTSYIAVNFIFIMRGAITASIGLMLLGLIPFSPTNWGMMLNLAISQSGGVFDPNALFYVLSPIVCIILFQLGCLFFAYGMDEVLNPRLRG
ncbi:peptide/nickel transport system permease protein [Caldanaerobius fijiensis DSM 17918]|uniref:Peptide/nickel transport system permease protein n=1 Tax=Caldanaerobius fijiensis DSM 17918 TaxID=1121256 RepID=A0A1M4XWW5_9THEO|nr:ABC transporter permease [Caldanaerobius fijiensis]SHE97732.1 peptide/nickel transport system permease protein [Caldanaerobius fijiensis DSM 17918]